MLEKILRKKSWEKQLQGERTYFCFIVKVTLSHGGEVTEVGADHICNQKAESYECILQPSSFSSPIQSRIPVENGVIHQWVSLPTSINEVKVIPIGMPRSLSHSKSVFFQVDEQH